MVRNLSVTEGGREVGRLGGREVGRSGGNLWGIEVLTHLKMISEEEGSIHVANPIDYAA